MKSLITLVLAILITIFSNLEYVEGSSESCWNDTDCTAGEYCFQGSCDVCRPCPSRNSDTTIDNEVPKCREDYEGKGIGVCPNFCARRRVPVTPDYSICEPEYTLSCQNMETTSENSLTAHVNWPEPSLSPSKEGTVIRQVSNEYHQGGPFPIGTTGLGYVATDSNGKLLASCTVNITVNDNQSPEITCPSDIVVYTSDAQPRCVNWTLPQATDNSGQCTVKPLNIEEDQTFKVGATVVIYQATDPSDNRKNCSFNVINKDIDLLCPEIKNNTWPGPVIIRADQNVRHSCSHQPGDKFPSGNMTVICSLYANGELITNKSCPVAIPDESGRPIRIVGIVVPVIVLVVIIIVIVVVKYRWDRYKLNSKKQLDQFPVPSPNPRDQQNNETTGLMSQSSSSDSNTGFREIDETRPEPDIQDVPTTPNSSIPNSTNYSILNSPNGYSSLSSTLDKGSVELTGNSINQCDQRIEDLLNHPDTVQQLCILLDPYESVLKSLGASYGLGPHHHKFILYYKEPHNFPVFEWILTFIKESAKPEDEGTGRQKIFRLLKELHDRRNGDAPIGEAIQNILGVHQSCPVCQQFAIDSRP